MNQPSNVPIKIAQIEDFIGDQLINRDKASLSSLAGVRYNYENVDRISQIGWHYLKYNYRSEGLTKKTELNRPLASIPALGSRSLTMKQHQGKRT